MLRIIPWLGAISWLLLLWPFPTSTILGTSLACATYPYYCSLQRKMSPRWAVAVYTICLLVWVLIPIATIVSLVVPQAFAGLKILDQLREPGFLQSIHADYFLDSLDAKLKNIPFLDGGIKELTSGAARLVGGSVRAVLAGGIGIAGGAFNAVLRLFIFIMITILCVVNAQLIYTTAYTLTGFSKDMFDRLVVTIRRAIFGVFAGIIFVSIVQGVLCGIGFYVANVPQPAFWGLIAACVAPIPFIGTSLVWIPVCAWLWIQGNTAAMVAMLVWCIFIVTGVDNLLRPFLLRSGIDASLVSLLLAVLCGLSAFGPIGILVGPVLVAFAIQASKECTSLSKNLG